MVVNLSARTQTVVSIFLAVGTQNFLSLKCEHTLEGIQSHYISFISEFGKNSFGLVQFYKMCTVIELKSKVGCFERLFVIIYMVEVFFHVMRMWSLQLLNCFLSKNVFKNILCCENNSIYVFESDILISKLLGSSDQGLANIPHDYDVPSPLSFRGQEMKYWLLISVFSK